MVFLLAMLVPAFAQDTGFDAHGFHLAAHDADLRDLLALQRPDAFRVGDWYAGGLLEYAEAPLIAVNPAGDRIPFLDNVLAANLSGGAVVHERVRLDLGVPVFVSSTGRNAGNGADLGDLRMSSMVAVLRPDDLAGQGMGLGIGVMPFLDVPTGATDEFLGQGTVSGGILAAGTAEFGKITTTLNVGPQFNPSLDLNNLPGADALILGVGGGYLPTDTLGLNLEVQGASPLKAASEPGTAAPWEALASVRHVREDGGHLTGGLGTAITGGAGAAAFRVFIGGGFGTSAKPAPEPEVVIRTPPPKEVVLPPTTPETGGLLVVASLDGEPSSGVDLNLVGPDGIQRIVSSNQGTAIPAEVGTTWSASASMGACLFGRAEVEVGIDQTYLHIPLERDQSALITVQAFDLNGEPITEGGMVVFLSDDPFCVPGIPVELDASGGAVVPLGPGSHTVLITADGYNDYEESITITSGGASEVIALLEGG